ncbi:MAG TPA: hypothetical protein VGO47_01515 [Chlamydiales bacterium]|nr:hypothetical protein [Chlamydiales bacterium]
MYKLYETLKALERPPSTEEIQVVSNVLPPESPIVQKILDEAKVKDGTLPALFDKQTKKEVCV